METDRVRERGEDEGKEREREREREREVRLHFCLSLEKDGVMAIVVNFELYELYCHLKFYELFNLMKKDQSLTVYNFVKLFHRLLIIMQCFKVFIFLISPGLLLLSVEIECTK